MLQAAGGFAFFNRKASTLADVLPLILPDTKAFKFRQYFK